MAKSVSYLQKFAALSLLACCALLTTARSDTRYQDGNLQRWSSEPNLSNRTRRPSSFHGRSGCKTNYRFDYTQLTLMWPPGACRTSSTECKRIESKHFTVHGMWPTIKGTQEPDFCCFDNTFYFDAIKPLLPALNEYWYSYYDLNDSRSFWRHEWLKHGTCARDIPALKGESNYFGTTLKMAKQLDVLSVLQKNNIVPDPSKTYRSADIVNALTKISKGRAVQIDCDYEHHQPVPILTGVNFCFDSNLEFADCPEMKRRCQRQLYFV